MSRIAEEPIGRESQSALWHPKAALRLPGTHGGKEAFQTYWPFREAPGAERGGHSDYHVTAMPKFVGREPEEMKWHSARFKQRVEKVVSEQVDCMLV